MVLNVALGYLPVRKEVNRVLETVALLVEKVVELLKNDDVVDDKMELLIIGTKLEVVLENGELVVTKLVVDVEVE